MCSLDGTSWVKVCASVMLEHAIDEVVTAHTCNATYVATKILTESAG
jgi:hypothetical protein